MEVPSCQEGNPTSSQITQLEHRVLSLFLTPKHSPSLLAHGRVRQFTDLDSVSLSRAVLRMVRHHDEACVDLQGLSSFTNGSTLGSVVADQHGYSLTMRGLIYARFKFFDRLESGEYWTHDRADLGHSWGKPGSKAKRPWRGCLVLSDPPTIIQCRSPLGSLRVVDSLNYYRESLADLGNHVGLPKLPMPGFDESDEAWFRYCERDTEILERAILSLLDMWRREDLGVFQNTAPALAMSAYRHRFMPHKLFRSTREDVIETERHAYYGGQSEHYFAGRILDEDDREGRIEARAGPLQLPAISGPVYHLDVRSLYPSVMLGNLFPVAYSKTLEGVSNDQCRDLAGRYGMCGYVQIRTEANTYPVRRKGRTHFARGRYWTALCGPEIVAALDRGDVEKVGVIHLYEQGRIFDEYVRYWWRTRSLALQSNDEIGAGFAKLMLNCLTGKWAQRASRWTDAPERISPVAYGVWLQISAKSRRTERYRAIAWHAQRMQPRGESRNSMPIISAYITAYGREKMRALRALAGERNVLLQDVDSLVVTETGYENLHRRNLVRDDLGMLRQLALPYSTGTIYGCRDYQLGDRIVLAGIKRSAVKLGDNLYEQEEFTGLEESLVSGPVNGVIVRKCLKILRRAYREGLSGNDGWRLPTEIRDDEPPPF
jgi:hypothetical protein